MSATISANCSITGATLAFGEYDPLSATPASANASALTVACTRGAGGVTIGLNTGSNPTHAVGTTRAMSNGAGDYLSYELYTSSSYLTVWSTTNTVALPTPSSMASTTLTVYGRIPALQNVSVGSYTDSVTATVNF